MKEALTKVKAALSRKDLISTLSHYRIGGHRIMAGDGRYTASAPIGFDGEFLVPGREFERLIERLPDDITIIQGENNVSIRGARMHGTIKTLEVDTSTYPTPGNVWNEIPTGFLEALAVLRPFISDNAIHQWALCACLGRDSMYATTNISAVEVDCPRLDGAGHLLPFWAIDYVLSRKEHKLTGVQIYPDYAAFRWDDDSWMRTQLINDEFPTALVNLFKTYKAPEFEIDDDWKAAYKIVAELTESVVEVHEEYLLGKDGEGSIKHEIPWTPVPSEGFSSWHKRFLDPVIKSATHWQPDVFPNPAPFSNDEGLLRGFVMGRR